MAKILILLPLLAGCAADDLSDAEAPVGAPQVEYSALGQEPGWTLRIDRDRIAYAGDGGRTRIAVARPPAQATVAGRRYATSRLTIDIAAGECRDAISGRGFSDRVTVIAGGRAVRGCGGDRLIERID